MVRLGEEGGEEEEEEEGKEEEQRSEVETGRRGLAGLGMVLLLLLLPLLLLLLPLMGPLLGLLPAPVAEGEEEWELQSSRFRFWPRLDRLAVNRCGEGGGRKEEG